MGYKSAMDVLPAELVKEIQNYIDGEYLYIPSLKRRAWGSKNGARALFSQRDRSIYADFQNGADRETLAHRYGLSIKGIEKVLTSQRKKER